MEIRQDSFPVLLKKIRYRSLRRGWDSNPCAREGKRFSRPPRYDHFDTSPDIFNAAKAQLYADPFLVSAFSILTKSDWLVNDFLIKKQCYLNILQFPIGRKP